MLKLQIGGVDITASPADINNLVGVTADKDEINFLDGATKGTAVAGKAVIYDDNSAIEATLLTGAQPNITSTGTLDSLTVTGATVLNGGLTMDSNKFTVADTTGDTSIGGTLTVTGDVTSSGAILQNSSYTALANLPNATVNNGSFVKEDTNGGAYYAHGGNWVKLLDSNPTRIEDLTETANAKFFTETEKTKLSNIDEDANNYTLPAAEAGVLGGVKVGSGLSVDSDGILSTSAASILSLSDTPSAFTANKVLKVNSAGDAIEFADEGGSFTSLSDTPNALIAGKVLKVNSGGNAIELADASGGHAIQDGGVTLNTRF